MSERRVLGLLLAGTLLAVPAQAQELDQLRRREAELTARRDDLHAQLSREASDRFRSQPRVVVSTGKLHVAFPEWAAGGTNEELIAALTAQAARYGVAIDSFLTDTLVIGVEADTVEGIPTFATMKYRIGPEDGSQWISVDRRHPGAWVAQFAGAALQHWAGGLIDRPLRSWLGTMDQRSTVASLRDPIVRDLVTSPSSRARRCLNGVTEECRLVLELDEVATPLLSAYDPTDLPELFQRMDLNARIPGRANCIGKRDTAACAELVRLGRAEPPHPLSMRSRQSLFAYALALGGEDAWLRLHQAQGRPIAEQLGAAAGRPVDSLVAAWQRDLLEGRHTTTAGLAPSLMLALAWTVVTLLFFAWRYRWRHV
jgi:hypothetical protein